jgi:heme A synthase
MQQAHLSHENRENAPRLFSLLALATALLTIGLIVFGAIVRVTDSGLGCGNSWPSCNGTIFPPLDNLTAWIEWLHRLFAALIGLLGLATLVVGWRSYRANRLAFGAVVLAAFLFLLQSALGAIVVILDLPPTMVALHLGTAMLLLAALLVAVVAARYSPVEYQERDHVTTLTYLTTGLSLVIILTGALVRGSGATLACIDWPLCNGDVFPFNQGQLAVIHMIHRFAVAALGITLILLVWQVLQSRSAWVRRFAILAFFAYLAQAGVGAMFVLSSAAPFWGAAHVGLAAATWACLVVLSVIEYLNSAGRAREQAAWKLQSNSISQ